MFSSKKPPSDIKKTSLKVLDSKRENSARLKYFKLLLDNTDCKDAQALFTGKITQIFGCFHESFETTEINLRQKGQKQQREELENLLIIFEKIILIFADVLQKGAFINCITQLFRKLLHPKNSPRLRKESMRLFLLWYGIIGKETASIEQDMLFCCLVPGLPALSPRLHRWMTLHFPIDAIKHSGWWCEDDCHPLVPQSPLESVAGEARVVLEQLLCFMLNPVVHSGFVQQQLEVLQRHFNFIFDKFKFYYIPVIFIDFRWSMGVYKPCLELPDDGNDRPVDSFLTECQELVVSWVCKFIQPSRNSHFTVTKERNPSGEENIPSIRLTDIETGIVTGEESGMLEMMVVRELLMNTTENVNFMHEVLRQAFLLHVRQYQTTLRVIHVYKDWIQMKGSEVPPFMMEPVDSNNQDEFVSSDGLVMRARPEVRAGMQSLLQLFIVNAANCFLLELGPGSINYLNRQVDLCKRVLNIYRYMVMNCKMEHATWTELLLVLLQITTQIVKREPPKDKSDTLGGRLAPALFQTLIVTWIKASLNVSVSVELWDQFLGVISSLTEWEELIKEWGKTMDTLTRVMARLNYNLNLNDLPLDKQIEGRKKRVLSREIQGVVHQHPTVLNKSFSRSFSRYASFENREHSLVMIKEKEALDSVEKVPVSVSISEGCNRPTERPPTLRRCKSEGALQDESIISPQEAEVKKFPSEYSCRVLPKHLYSSRSVEFLPVISSISEDGTRHSRSPSPAPSGASISKDSPMCIEVLNTEGCSSLESTDTESKSVMAQGSLTGWQPEVSVALWCRMLGGLGDPNNLAPFIHSLVFEYLNELAQTLIKLRNNQGLSLDNLSTPPPPDLIPPLHFFNTWCFKAALLPSEFKKGRRLAYQTLLKLTLHKQDVPLSKDYLALFYLVLHRGLSSSDQSIINTIIEHCCWMLVCLNLAGSSMLLLDMLTAAESISLSDNPKMPRVEALKTVASFVGELRDRCLVLHPDPWDLKVVEFAEPLESIVDILLNCGLRDPDPTAQSMALCSLGTYIYQELSFHSLHHQLDKSFEVLMTALHMRNNSCSQVSADVLGVLCDHAEYLVKHSSSIPSTIIKALTSALSRCSSDKRLLTSLLFTLASWCMNMPKQALLNTTKPDKPLIHQVFKVLNQLLEEGEDKNTPSNSPYKTHSPRRDRVEIFISESPKSPKKVAKLATDNVWMHLINQLLHFPMRSGAARVNSVVVEHDDIPGMSCDELRYDAFLQPNLELFMLNESRLLSLIELPSLEEECSDGLGLMMAERQVRLIMRDISGKITWDTSVLYAPKQTVSATNINWREVLSPSRRGSRIGKSEESLYLGGYNTLRHRPTSVLPHYKDTTEDLDNLDDLLAYIGHSSPECMEGVQLNDPGFAPSPLSSESEDDWITAALNQRNQELDYCHKQSLSNTMSAVSETQPETVAPSSAFQHSRLLFSQLGFSSSEQRDNVYLVQKNQKLLRELKNLDNQKCRETHKFAVIYVADGQEDKASILSNNGGSDSYEEFVGGLGWEVELSVHTGFLGGLQRNGSTGDTAPYYADSFTEVIFHVATRMPSHTDEALLQKTRHLGNDEVHIVWSEHGRDYRRGIIPTEFCDVLIVIYPLKNFMYRIQIHRKPEVPFFGPLFDGVTVNERVLPGLVRATAINASRAKRAGIPLYQNYYEERACALQTIFENYRAQTTFEEFMGSVCYPSGSSNSGTENRVRKCNVGAMIDSKNLHVLTTATRTSSSDT